jgi:hypothetical protein
LQAAGVDGPEDQVGVFNGRRLLRGRIGAHDVVLGLTGIGSPTRINTTPRRSTGSRAAASR